MDRIRIAVLGAGIGGLATAAALLRAGIPCTVFEQAPRLTDVGAGIQISPNGARLLHGLGIGAALGTVAVRPEAVELRRWRSGRVIGRIELGAAAEARYGAPYYTLHRADLIAALVGAVARHGGTIRLNHRCVEVVETRDLVELRFANGTVHPADVVVGADGLNSVVRRLVGTDHPRFSGATVYRGLIPIDRVPWLRASAKVVVWLGPGQHCVCYPVSCGRAVSVSATSPAVTPPPPSASSSAEALATYAGWHEDVAGLLAAADRLTRWALYDRAPLARWCTQRCVVIGDAAHPMLPFIAQGATQAIEDAVTVAACLRSADKEDPAGALRRYEQIRRPRIGRVDAAVIASVRDHHLADGARQRQRDRRLGEAGGVAGLHWLYGHDAERAAREVAVHPL